jgi:aldehyde:ferredoxin oxidoreductase
VVKGQALPAYDPRSVQGIGVTYATSTMGADHTAGYAVAANVLGVGDAVDPLKPEGQVALSRNLQIATAAIDATGLCLFIAFAILDQEDTFNAMLDMLDAFTGQKLTADDVVALGKKILDYERDFNTRAGFTSKQDRLPDFFKNEPLPPHNVQMPGFYPETGRQGRIQAYQDKLHCRVWPKRTEQPEPGHWI